MAEPITIIIKKNGSGGSSDVGGVPTPNELADAQNKEKGKMPSESQEQEKGGTDLNTQAVNAALIDAGKQIAMNAVAQYGNFTGNTIAQNRINATLEFGAMALMLVKSPIIGSIAIASQLAIDSVNRSIELEKENNKAALIRQRNGDASTNGGRGTNN